MKREFLFLLIPLAIFGDEIEWQDVPPDTKITVVDGRIETATGEVDPIYLSEKSTFADKYTMDRITLQMNASNVWFAVTNYYSETKLPSLSLWEMRDNDKRLVWDERTLNEQVMNAANVYTDELIDEVYEAMPSKAWGDYSASGNDVSEDAVLVDKPSVVLAGGYEWEKVVSASNSVFVLRNNGVVAIGESGGKFAVTKPSGEILMEFDVKDEVTIGVDTASAEMESDGVFVCTYNTNVKPKMFCSLTLGGKFKREDEEDCPCVVEWNNAPPYVARVTLKEKGSRCFMYGAEVFAESNLVRFGGGVEAQGGIKCKDSDYYVVPKVVNGQVVWEIAE